MNNQLIEQIIKTNNIPCPEFVYENPLLDSSVASALSKSFVKILNISQQNSNVSNNLRLSILENIRKLCQIEPENHLKVDEKLTDLLTEAYVEKIQISTKQGEVSIRKRLDAFLLRRMTTMNLNTQWESYVNPEIVQALLNLNQGDNHLESLTQDIIHWNSSNKHSSLLKNLWSTREQENISKTVIDDVPIKLKNELEKIMLELCHTILKNRNSKIEDLISSNVAVGNLIIKSSSSVECFRICSAILNSIFVMANFDNRMEELIAFFVKSVKQSCPHVSISVLYPIHISHIVVLMDIDVNIFPMELSIDYNNSTMKYLSEVKLESDIILLLSHFPQWFDIYLNHMGSS